EAYTTVPNETLAASLRRGDPVLLDGQGRALLFRIPLNESTGESALLERRIGAKRVVVTMRGDERAVFYASQDLTEKLDKGEVQPGSQVLVNARQRVAFDVIPAADGLSHYR